jgi:hypothetical protein
VIKGEYRSAPDLGWKLRYVSEKYKAQAPFSGTVDGSHVGLLMNWYLSSAGGAAAGHLGACGDVSLGLHDQAPLPCAGRGPFVVRHTHCTANAPESRASAGANAPCMIDAPM